MTDQQRIDARMRLCPKRHYAARLHMQTLSKREIAEDVARACSGRGNEYAMGGALVSFAVGDVVEYDMLAARKTQRATVTRIDDDGTVHVRFSRTNARGRQVARDIDVWFSPHEIRRLRHVKEQP